MLAGAHQPVVRANRSQSRLNGVLGALYKTWHCVLEYASELVFVLSERLRRNLGICIRETENRLQRQPLNAHNVVKRREHDKPSLCHG